VFLINIELCVHELVIIGLTVAHFAIIEDAGFLNYPARTMQRGISTCREFIFRILDFALQLTVS